MRQSCRSKVREERFLVLDGDHRMNKISRLVGNVKFLAFLTMSDAVSVRGRFLILAVLVTCVACEVSVSIPSIDQTLISNLKARIKGRGNDDVPEGQAMRLDSFSRANIDGYHIDRLNGEANGEDQRSLHADI